MYSKVHQINFFPDFSYTEGPTMQIQRYQHACGTFEQDGKPMVIVMGGYAMAFAQRTSEVLDLTTMQWKTGKKKFKISRNFI